MKKLSKILTLLLTALMIMAIFSISAFAYTDGGKVYYSSGSFTVSNDPLYAAASPESVLSDLEKAIYNELKAKIVLVANGSLTSTSFTLESDLSELSWTKEELGCTIVSGGAITSAAQSAISEKVAMAIDFQYILQCLLAEYPYELFWYDKTVGVSYGYGLSGTSNELHITNLHASFCVSADFRSGNATDYTTNSSKIASANASVANAESIVAKYEDKTDIEKLEGYRDEICNLVSYNTSAAGGGYSYGNPWQIIYVFDGNSSTNVVCEGYAKAFKYLCDLSDFDKEIYCYLVSGELQSNGSSEGHMWNVIVMDGANYMVDVTNYDGYASIRSDLFLGGGESSNNGRTHVMPCGLTYVYYENQMDFYCEGYLVLTGDTFHEHSYSANWSTNNSQHWHQCSCGDKIDLEDHSPSSAGSCLQRPTCIVCGVKYGSFLSHNYNKQIIDQDHLKSAATCTAKATYYYSCSCGAIGDSFFEYGETLDHTYNQKKVLDSALKAEATCTSLAEYYLTCTCGAVGDEYFKYGNLLPHDYSERNTDAKYLETPATCTDRATYHYSCECGAEGEETFEYGKLLDHSFVDGVCSECGINDEDYNNTDDPNPGDDTNPDDDTNLDDDTNPDDEIDDPNAPKSFIELLIEFIINLILSLLGLE